ncbi:MAG: hypothetical protein HY042_07240 [Spirochaetia bacterium]|nr:hypothetical protein [Spirochaetia bacterium]
MKAYRLTEADSIRAALQKTKGLTGRSEGRECRITSVSAETNAADAVILEVTGSPGMLLTFGFKDNLLRVRLNKLDDTHFSVKDVSIEPVQRGAARVFNIEVDAVDVQVTPPVDIASSVALYGRTSSIARICQMMKMQLHEHLNTRGFMISESDIGFFYNTDSPLLVEMETKGKIFFLIDCLARKVVKEPEFHDYSADMTEAKQDAFFTQLSREKVRSEFIFPFREHSGTPMGHITLRSTMPGLGNHILGAAQPKDLKILTAYLLERSEALVFEMEMTAVKGWAKVSDKLEIQDLSQDGRGIRFTVPGQGLEKVVRRGGKVQFVLRPGDNPEHGYIGTVRNAKPVPEGMSVGVRIQRGSHPDSLDLLGRFARSLRPALDKA